MPISSQAVAAFHQFVAEAICGASRRMNSRPARASSMRRRTWVPKYGAGLGLRTVAWISCRSSVGASVDVLPLTDSVTVVMGDPSLLKLVEEFLECLADPREPTRLRYRQIRIGNVPGVGRDLVLDEPVLDVRMVDPRPPLEVAEEDVHRRRDLGHEVVDVGVPLAVVRGGEEQLRVVFQE